MKRKVLMSLDEQIKLLESEINNDSGMSDDESDSDKEIVEDSDHELIIEKDKGGNILRMYSKPKGIIINIACALISLHCTYFVILWPCSCDSTTKKRVFTGT